MMRMEESGDVHRAARHRPALEDGRAKVPAGKGRGAGGKEEVAAVAEMRSKSGRAAKDRAGREGGMRRHNLQESAASPMCARTYGWDGGIVAASPCREGRDAASAAAVTLQTPPVDAARP